MPLVQSQVVSLPSPDLIKMEERKRPANHGHDDSAPPLKKQATSINGAAKAHVDADMPWKDELEVWNESLLPPFPSLFPSKEIPRDKWLLTRALLAVQRFQKEAIWRQMQEHKRERNSVENRLTEVTKSAQYHDEHIMIIDAWFSQVSHPSCYHLRVDADLHKATRRGKARGWGYR